ncbi:MAG: N-acetylmuramoyl-L-alanine amidase [Saccharofermentans sp.]|nr:N-acetylmuramoyl-L-alanine amidase [Saccharofermentans sp.]
MTSTKIMRRVFSIALAVIVVFTGLKLFPENASADVPYKLSGVAHVQDQGDTPGTFDSTTGELVLGTEGLSRRLESITINFENNTGYEGTIEYKVHVQDIGWMDWVEAGGAAGTTGKAKRLEGIYMQLTGELANHFTIEYWVHIQDYGDSQGWVEEGELAGTTGESKRLEKLHVRIVSIDAPGATLKYKVHVQDFGWEKKWKADGETSGTNGKGKRLEGIYIDYCGTEYSGGITYCTHVQDIGWQEWKNDGELSGTTGQSKRLEGIKIKLTGDVANYYDVYYRVHCECFGWLGWAKNGEFAGTEGMGKRLEAIQIILVAKGGAAPGDLNGVKSNTKDSSYPGDEIIVCLDAGHIGKYNQCPSVPEYYESDFTWKFHLYLKEELEKYGIIVVLTRSDQYESLGVYERGLAAQGCDLFISIHSDASSNTKYTNPSAYCCINGTADTIGLQLAQTISKDMGVAPAQLYHRVGENGDYYGVLRGCSAVGVPGVLLEHSFYTNPNSAKWMLNDDNLKKLAQDEALVIAQYFGLA